MDIIFNRRSIRSFENRPVEKDKIDKILQAAMQAPSAGNQQPWEFIVVEERETLLKLSQMTPYAKPVEQAGVAFVVLNNKSLGYPSSWQQDLSAATQNMLLEATYLGLGSLWLGVSTLDTAMDYVSELFRLPDNIRPFALVAAGYPKNQKNEFVDRYVKEKVHYESYKEI